MHARVISGVFVALGLADLTVMNLVLAPRLIVHDPRPAATAPVPSCAPAPPPAVVAPPVPSAPPAPLPTAADVIFELDSQRIAGGESAVDLRRVAVALRDTPERRLLLRGHADRLGSAEHNLSLSRWRAEAVQRYLVEQGAPAERMDLEAVGDAEPVDWHDTPRAWAQNRRVQILWR